MHYCDAKVQRNYNCYNVYFNECLQLKTITFEKAHAEVFKFDKGTEVQEYHMMLHVDDATAT